MNLFAHPHLKYKRKKDPTINAPPFKTHAPTNLVKIRFPYPVNVASTHSEILSVLKYTARATHLYFKKSHKSYRISINATHWIDWIYMNAYY